jgi:hypothetical protein
MTNIEQIAVVLLDNAEVMEEFEEFLWIKVDRDDWEALQEQLNEQQELTASSLRVG